MDSDTVHSNLAETAPNNRRTPRKLTWYFVGITLIGLAIGYYCGLSESPVVATLLPLLFTLIGGSTGLYLLKANFDNDETVKRLNLLGKTYFLIAASCVLATSYSITIRTGTTLSDFLPQPSVMTTVVSSGDVTDDLSLALLNAKLRQLQVSATDIQAILMKASNAIAGTLTAETADELTQLSLKASAVEGLLTTISGPDDLQSLIDEEITQEELERIPLYHPVLNALYLQVKSIQPLIAQWNSKKNDANGAPVVARSTFVAMLNNLQANVSDFHGHPVGRTPAPVEAMSIYVWLETFGESKNADVSALMDYENYVLHLNEKYGSVAWLGDDVEISEAINEFIETRGSMEPARTTRPTMKH